MPCYNAEATITRSVESILAQTFTDWELIIVDDGSSDASSRITTDLADRNPRIRSISQCHGGVVAASNHGFTLARAPIIARMDADDVSRSQRLEKQWRALQSQPDLHAITSLANFAGDTANAEGYAHYVAWTNRQKTSKDIELNRFVDLPFPHPTLMYRRELVEKCGGYREGNFPEDFEMILRWIDAGASIDKVDEILYDWHDPPTRLSRNDPRYDPMAFHRCKASYLTKAIVKSGCDNRELWIWGAGRPARKCARPLEDAWKQASGFIDIDPHKIGRDLHGRPVVSQHQLPPADNSVIVSYVGTRGARDSIRTELLKAGRLEGKDFWIAC